MIYLDNSASLISIFIIGFLFQKHFRRGELLK